MSGTISTVITTSQTLTVNPTTIAATGAVLPSSGIAVYGGTGTSWSVANYGGISATNTLALVLAAGGTVSNFASGSISGGYGVQIRGGAGTLVNSGSINGVYFTGTFGDQAGGYAAILAGGGAVANGATGIITGTRVGVTISGTAGGLFNAGQITGTTFRGVALGAARFRTT